MAKLKYNGDLPLEIRRIYSRAKASAVFRREEWAFTFDTWYDMWQASGFWPYRGREPHQYCMVRLDPIEAWGPHNCIIVTRRQFMKKNAYENFVPGFPKVPWQRKHAARKRI